jgi:hypothetical protein
LIVVNFYRFNTLLKAKGVCTLRYTSWLSWRKTNTIPNQSNSIIKKLPCTYFGLLINYAYTNNFFSLYLANALKCWRCSSDASSAAFCGDPFDTSLISEQQRRWSYVDCSFPPAQQQPFGAIGQTRPVCKKMKQLSKYFELSECNKLLVDIKKCWKSLPKINQTLNLHIIDCQARC